MVLVSNVDSLAFLLLMSNYFDVDTLVSYLWIWACYGVCFGRRKYETHVHPTWKGILLDT